jgi:hypothetical protein
MLERSCGDILNQYVYNFQKVCGLFSRKNRPKSFKTRAMTLHTERKAAAACGKLIHWRRDGEQIVRHMMTHRGCVIYSL